MFKEYSALEIFEKAIMIEKRGKTFYKNLAEQTEDKKTKELFLFLADEESNHIEFFEKQLKKYEEEKHLKFDPDDMPPEYQSYLNSLISSDIFDETDFSILKSNFTSTRDIINAAIYLEKDSILFYKEIKDKIIDEDKEFVDTIINEERKHINMLFNLKQNL